MFVFVCVFMCLVVCVCVHEFVSVLHTEEKVRSVTAAAAQSTAQEAACFIKV